MEGLATRLSRIVLLISCVSMNTCGATHPGLVTHQNLNSFINIKMVRLESRTNRKKEKKTVDFNLKAAKVDGTNLPFCQSLPKTGSRQGALGSV